MDPSGEDQSRGFLDTVEGEIALFRSIMRARPIGIHRHFHVLTIRNAILRDTGQDVSISEIWDKLKSCYDLDILESIVRAVSVPSCPASCLSFIHRKQMGMTLPVKSARPA